MVVERSMCRSGRGRRLRQGQHDVALGGVVAIDADTVGGASDGIEGEAAGDGVDGGVIVVAGDKRESVDGGAFVDGEEGVEVAAVGVEVDGAGGGSGPVVPDGVAADVAGV